MHLADAGLLDDRGHVVGADAAAGHHHQRVAGTRHHARDRRRAGRGGVGATRREHAIDAERQQRLERLDRIARRVDRLVAGHRQRPRHVDQAAHDARRRSSRRAEARRSTTPCAPAAAAARMCVRHRRDLAGVVDEVAAARADHHEHRDGQRRGAALDQRGVGRGAAHVEAGAQLDAARSPARRRQRGAVRIDAGLEQRGTPGIRGSRARAGRASRLGARPRTGNSSSTASSWRIVSGR